MNLYCSDAKQVIIYEGKSIDNTELGLCQKPLVFNHCVCHKNLIRVRPNIMKIYTKEIENAFINIYVNYFPTRQESRVTLN